MIADMQPLVAIQKEVEKAENKFVQATGPWQAQCEVYNAAKKALEDLYAKREEIIKQVFGEPKL